MANYGRILTGSTLNQADVDATLRRIVKERFGDTIQVELMEGTGHFYKYGYWFVFHKDYEKNQVATTFWIEDEVAYGKEKNGKWREYSEPKVMSTGSMIVVEHGYGMTPMYYVEGIIREELGKLYGARMADDGCSGEWKPKPENYVDFQTWKNSIRGYEKNWPVDDGFYNEALNGAHRLPKELRERIGIKDEDLELDLQLRHSKKYKN